MTTLRNEHLGLSKIKIIGLLLCLGVGAMSVAGCSSTEERIGGAGTGAVAGGAVAGPVGAVAGGVAGAVTGPTVAHHMGIPHSRTARHRHHATHREDMPQ